MSQLLLGPPITIVILVLDGTNSSPCLSSDSGQTPEITVHSEKGNFQRLALSEYDQWQCATCYPVLDVYRVYGVLVAMPDVKSDRRPSHLYCVYQRVSGAMFTVSLPRPALVGRSALLGPPS